MWLRGPVDWPLHRTTVGFLFPRKDNVIVFALGTISITEYSNPTLTRRRANGILVEVSKSDIEKARKILQKRVPRPRELRYAVIRHHLPRPLKDDERKTAELVAKIVKGFDEIPKKPRGLEPKRPKKDIYDDYFYTPDGIEYRK